MKVELGMSPKSIRHDSWIVICMLNWECNLNPLDVIHGL